MLVTSPSCLSVLNVALETEEKTVLKLKDFFLLQVFLSFYWHVYPSLTDVVCQSQSTLTNTSSSSVYNRYPAFPIDTERKNDKKKEKKKKERTNLREGQTRVWEGPIAHEGSLFSKGLCFLYWLRASQISRLVDPLWTRGHCGTGWARTQSRRHSLPPLRARERRQRDPCWGKSDRTAPRDTGAQLPPLPRWTGVRDGGKDGGRERETEREPSHIKTWMEWWRFWGSMLETKAPEKKGREGGRICLFIMSHSENKKMRWRTVVNFSSFNVTAYSIWT